MLLQTGFSVLLLVIVAFQVALCEVVVTTKYGKIRGVASNKIKAFLGVPYAAPPVGKLRWKNPVSVSKWSPKVYDATKVKPGCPQKGCETMNPVLVCPVQTAEDCLYLYIWTPLSANATTSFPVMVYIHGGNFVHMSADSLLFNAEELAYRGQVIVVTMDYRLGALGFLLTQDRRASSNYAILDQRQAMKWVKDNIRAFGGNPNMVTLFGQSAGAQSTVAHLLTKESSQYFQRAIVESAPLSIPFKTEEEMIFISNMLFDQLKCSPKDLDCLNKYSADEIAEAQLQIRKYPSSLKLLEFFEPWVPYVDGVIIPSQPLEAFRKGLVINKPLMMGTVSEETRIFIYEAYNKSLPALEYSLALSLTFPKKALDVLQMYPPTVEPDQRDGLQIPATDFIFTCCTRNFTRNVLKQNGGLVWTYVYDHAFSFPGWGKFTFCEGHVCHGSEIPFVFQSSKLGNFTITPDEVKLSNSLIAYWSNFAKTGNPNRGAPVTLQWPIYEPSSLWPQMYFATPSNSVKSSYRKEFCDFWDSLGYNPLG
ncbi:cAMP-regulated D2 protein-like [Saccostrea cucullata]|uniref:cAMP-regulated D2 protein-like n=1 Tax=Saccostrea cuccullata TaxID=36930 RepID=UPI002ED3D523